MGAGRGTRSEGALELSALANATTRRRFLRGAAGTAAALYAGGVLAACADTTLPGGTRSPNLGPGGLPLARPDNPVTLPIYPTTSRSPPG